MKNLKIIAKAVITTLLIIGCGYYLKIQYPKYALKHKIERLNVSLMSFNLGYLLSLDRGEQIPLDQLKHFIDYYELFTDFFPEVPGSYSMLGFLYGHVHQTELSLRAYEEALRLRPNYFWDYHNMGIVYLSNGRYEEAVSSFMKALNTDVRQALNYLLSSMYTYRFLIKELNIDDTQTALIQRLNEGYRQTVKLLIISQYYDQDFTSMRDNAQRAIDLNLPGGDEFQYYLGMSLRPLGDPRSSEVMKKVRGKYRLDEKVYPRLF